MVAEVWSPDPAWKLTAVLPHLSGTTLFPRFRTTELPTSTYWSVAHYEICFSYSYRSTSAFADICPAITQYLPVFGQISSVYSSESGSRSAYFAYQDSDTGIFIHSEWPSFCQTTEVGVHDPHFRIFCSTHPNFHITTNSNDSIFTPTSGNTSQRSFYLPAIIIKYIISTSFSTIYPIQNTSSNTASCQPYPVHTYGTDCNFAANQITCDATSQRHSNWKNFGRQQKNLCQMGWSTITLDIFPSQMGHILP